MKIIFRTKDLLAVTKTQGERLRIDKGTQADNGWDAFRHALSSAIIARDGGPLLAQLIGDEYELLYFSNPYNPQSFDERVSSREMDLYNNNIGILIALDLGSGASDEQLADAVWDALDRGELRVIMTEQGTAVTPEGFHEIPIGMHEGMVTAAILKQMRDPLVLDLDGDGLELSSASGSVLFDHNADGIKTGTGWVNSDDGLLVRDLNSNGSIDSGRELFGVDTLKINNKFATDGFDAIKDLDENNDNFITSLDSSFSSLRIWQDINQDGISQASELKTLAQLGISSINANGSSSGPLAGQTINNNVVAMSSTFVRNGVARTVGAIDFEQNTFTTAFPSSQATGVAWASSVGGLPWLQGSGMVTDTLSAATLSPSFAAVLLSMSGTTGRSTQLSQIEGFVEEWAKTSSMYPSGILNPLNTSVQISLPTGVSESSFRRMINVLEAFNGSRFYDLDPSVPRVAGFNVIQVGSAQIVSIAPTQQQLDLLTDSYNILKNSVLTAIGVKTRLQQYDETIGLEVVGSTTSYDFSGLQLALQSKRIANPSEAIDDLADLIRINYSNYQKIGFDAVQLLRTWIADLPSGSPILTDLAAKGVILGSLSVGLTGFDLYLGNSSGNSFDAGKGNDFIVGDSGDDTLSGGVGSDYLIGGSGNDYLYGESLFGGGVVGDNDYLEGGAGNDFLVGGGGSDLYVFGRGDGQDTINNRGQDPVSALPDSLAVDEIVFKSGISPAEINVIRSNLNLIVKIVGTTDQITVVNFFQNVDLALQPSMLDKITFDDGSSWNVQEIKARVLVGTALSDQLTGYQSDDFLNGLAGNDVIYGHAGNDTIFGGGGVDFLAGDDGNDAIEGGADDDTINGDAGNDILNGGEGIDVLTGGLGSDVVSGGLGNDTLYGDGIYGGGGLGDDDVLDGGAGNDYLVGGGGSDTYLFGKGDGQDILVNRGQDPVASIPDAAAIDILLFKVGVAPSEVALSRSNLNLVVKITGTADQVTVTNFFLNSDSSDQGYMIDQIKFNDGTIWSIADIRSKVLLGTAANDQLTGYGTEDVINGLAGNDTIYGKAGNDILNGGDGVDFISGDEGNDTIDGGTGDDTINGLDGDDQIYGAAGADIMSGGIGNDTIFGGIGNDALDGGAGADVYQFSRGDGADTILDYDATAAVLDKFQYAANIAADQLWFRKVGNNLEVSVIGTSDKETITNWYTGSTNHVERFLSGDGKTLQDTQVQNLVQAMAAFTPPAAGQTTLSSSYATALAPTLAANWA